MKPVFIFLVLVVPFWVNAQKITDISFAEEGDKIKISYTLIGDYPEQTFEVKIFTSVDNFTAPLQQIEGDVNRKNIKPGKKEALWDAKKEYKLFEGNISFKIVADVISNYWISAPTKGEVLKRGKKYEITWMGFKPGTPVKITITEGSGKMTEIASNVTTNSYMWKIKGKAGEGSTIKVTAIDDNSANAKSGQFVIKRAIPLAAQLGTAAIVAGGAAWYVLRPPVMEPLPEPPGPSK